MAAIFSGLGLWLGLRITGRKETVVVREVTVEAPVAFVRDDHRLGKEFRFIP